MLFIISPAKSLDFNPQNLPSKFSNPLFLQKSYELILNLRRKTEQDLKSLMKISDNLAKLNFERYKNFTLPFDINNSKPALYVFNGDVYESIDVENYNQEDIQFAQNNLRILSGLYGVLKPLDLIQPYRLEMGTKLQNSKGKNLYEFWQKDIVDYFNEEIEKNNSKFIVNLASNEYSNVIDQKNLQADLINITFKNNKDGIYKNIGIFAKRARGMMANFIIKNKVNNLDDLKLFNESGYKFKPEFSNSLNYHFYN
jgi:cytoplasmic iron level regulating protein YaaA (DUF328/UPF0246 family)